MGPLQHTTKKFPQEPASLWSGTGAITVITSESQHYLHCSPLFPRRECVRLGLGNAATLYCPSLALPFFLFTHFCSVDFLFSSFDSFLTSNPLADAHSHIFSSLSQEHMFIYSPLFSVVCKAEFVPVGWKSNEGKSRCYCAAVDCAPPTPPSLLTVSPKQDRCSVCMLPAFPTSIFLPGIPDYCSICLIVVSQCLLFVQCDVLEVSASI